MVTKKKQKPLPEFLYPNIKPFGISELEHASGTDFLAIETSLNRFKEWLTDKKNKKFLEEAMAELPPHELQQAQGRLRAIESIEAALRDFEKRYGKRKYLSGVTRAVELEETLTLDSLDDATRRTADSLISQHENFTIDKKGVQHFTTSYDEIMEKLDKKEISLKEAVELDNDLERKQSIAMAIEHQLRDLQRELWISIAEVPRAFRKKIQNLRHLKDETRNELWRKFYEVNPEDRVTRPDGKSRYTEEYQKRAKKFTNIELPKKLLSFDKKMALFETKEKELVEIRESGSLALCSVCRKSPVQIHYGQHDRQVVVEPICDDCLKSGETMDSNYSSWKCDYCDKLLYRFANRNILHSKLLNKAEARITLEYGQISIQGKCTGCGYISQRTLDWGWQA